MPVVAGVKEIGGHFYGCSCGCFALARHKDHLGSIRSYLGDLSGLSRCRNQDLGRHSCCYSICGNCCTTIPRTVFDHRRNPLLLQEGKHHRRPTILERSCWSKPFELESTESPFVLARNQRGAPLAQAHGFLNYQRKRCSIPPYGSDTLVDLITPNSIKRCQHQWPARRRAPYFFCKWVGGFIDWIDISDHYFCLAVLQSNMSHIKYISAHSGRTMFFP